MQPLKPSVNPQEIACAEIAAPPCAMVVFGASGDLAHRKLIPGLFALSQRGLLAGQSYLLGCGRQKLTDQDFRDLTRRTLHTASPHSPADSIESFTDRLYYLSGDYDDGTFYNRIKQNLAQLDNQRRSSGAYIFYLAVPPTLFAVIAEHLAAGGFCPAAAAPAAPQIRLVVEKPFGQDLASATEFNRRLARCFAESQIYRIDHYLGKETVQNILMLRFANTIFEPIWNRSYIDHIQLTIAESLGVEHRAGYYDRAGALRDMFQNHLLAILSLTAMEPPASFDADCLRDEKAKVLRAIRPFDPAKLDELVVPGQYTAGQIQAAPVPGYRQEPGVSPDSRTETFIAAKLFIDNQRWKDVPFYLRTGKRLACKLSEVAVVFKQVPHSIFAAAGLGQLPANVLVLKIQPAEGISLSFQAKRPGSKLCMSTLTMSFDYRQVFGAEPPDAYQRLLLDCMLGDQMLFDRYDAVELSWRLLTPVLNTWQQQKMLPHPYPAGSESFPAADSLIETDGRKWRRLSQNDT